MSATGRSDVRRKDDHYVTPAWCVHALWPHLSAFDTCLDPCAGEGAILLALREMALSPVYCGIEIDAERAHRCDIQNRITCMQGDALLTDPAYFSSPWRTGALPYDLIIMNPPYSLALEFIQAALRSGAAEIAVLLRLNFLASEKRAKFWKEHPCDVYVLPKRPSFATFLSCVDCDWKASFPVGAELPRQCPSLHGSKRLKKCTSDATEYMWAVFRQGKTRKGCAQGRGHWSILDVP